MKAIQKRAASPRFAPGRATPAMCLSDGYDSGAIAASLGRLGIQPAMYTVQAREVPGDAMLVLVVWNMCFFSFRILGTIIIPDDLMFLRGMAQPQEWHNGTSMGPEASRITLIHHFQ